MPKLAQYRQQAIERQASPAAPIVNTSQAESVSNLASGIGQFMKSQQVMSQREARDYTINQRNKVTVDFAAYESELSQTAATGTEYSEGISKFIEAEKQKAMDAAPSQVASEEVARYFETLKASEASRAIPVAAKINARNSANAIKDSVDISMNVVFRDPSRFEEQLEIGSQAIELSDMPQNLKEQAVKEYANSLTSQRVLGMIEKSPEQALNELKSGAFDDSLSPQQTIAYTKSAESQATAMERDRAAQLKSLEIQNKKQAESNNAALASDLEINVSRGESGYRDVEAAFNNGVITAQKRTQLYKQIDGNIEKANAYNENVAIASAAINSGMPLDYRNKNHQKWVDDYFDNLPQEAKMDPNSIAGLVASTKVVPSQIQTIISAGIRGSSEQAQAASDIVARMNDQAPQAVASLPTDVKAFALSMDKLVRSGVSPAKAYELTNNSIYGTTKEQREVLNMKVSSKDFKADNASKFENAVDDISPSYFTPKRTPSMDAMEAEYNNAVNNYYLLTHDQEVAQNLAKTDLQKVWGTTWVDGKERMMKYSPEKMYGNGQESKWIYDQLKVEMEAEGIETYSIQSDKKTGRESPPGYQIMKEVDGVMVPHFKDGVAMRWRPDISTSGILEEVAKDKQSAMDRARSAQENKRPVPASGYPLSRGN